MTTEIIREWTADGYRYQLAKRDGVPFVLYKPLDDDGDFQVFHEGEAAFDWLAREIKSLDRKRDET